MPPAEHCRVELKVPNDSRALGAVRGALQHTARHLGLPAREEEELIASSNQLLRSAFTALSNEQEVFVFIQEHPDRIEIEMVRPGGGTVEWDAAQKLPGIDQAEQETSASRTRLKLVKFLPSAAKKPHSSD